MKYLVVYNDSKLTCKLGIVEYLKYICITNNNIIMKILENHFEGNPTYIVGSYIRNGCQTFHVNEAQTVFNRFEVPIRMQQEVLSYIDREEDLTPYINHGDWRVRLLVAKQGYGLDTFIKDEEWGVRQEVAKQGYGLDILVKDEYRKVRLEAVVQLKLLKN